MHARKTRERKKAESAALQKRIEDLKDESKFLQQLVMDRYTAGVLVGLKSEGSRDEMDTKDAKENLATLVSSPLTLTSMSTSVDALSSQLNSGAPIQKAKRCRSREKCTPQERLRLRRERNRLHAKHTRDRKKFVLEASERIIHDMELEVMGLRKHLVSINLLSEDDLAKSVERDSSSKRHLALLKGTQTVTHFRLLYSTNTHTRTHNRHPFSLFPPPHTTTTTTCKLLGIRNSSKIQEKEKTQKRKATMTWTRKPNPKKMGMATTNILQPQMTVGAGEALLTSTAKH